MLLKNHTNTLFDCTHNRCLEYYLLNRFRSTMLGILLLLFPGFSVLGYQTDPPALEIRHFINSPSGVETIEQSRRDVPIVGQADVIVAGGGVAGVAAALKAAGQGLSVIIIESRNYLGQELTATYHCKATAEMPGSSQPLARSISMELEEDGVVKGENLDPDALRSYLHKKVVEQPNIKVYFYSLANGVVVENKQVRGVVFTDMNGRQALLGKVVIDATEDARIAAAAGARFIRNLSGAKTARRFISARLPASLSPGSHEVASNLGLSGNQIMVHQNFVEFSVEVNMGDDLAAGLSEIQATTLEKSFALRNYLMREGIMMGNFTPAPEAFIDEMPVLACREPLKISDIEAPDFRNQESVLPVGVEGLVVTGRTIDTRSQIGNLQSLLSVGELAGNTSATLSRSAKALPELTSLVSKEKNYGKGKVRELLDGMEPDINYPGIHQSSVQLPVRGKFDVLVVGGGTSGAIAAIAAARQGARVAVIEILPNLGGISSNRVTGYYWGAPWKSLLRQEIGERIHLVKRPGEGALEKVRFSGEDKKYALQDLALREGVQIYYQSLAAGVVVEDKQVQGVVVENVVGRHILLADVVIDATGQAGIAVAAGAAFAKGRDTDGFLMEIEHGPLRDPTHTGDISSYYLQFPSNAVSLNIRESRRIIGDYTVTFEDAIHERLFPDNIGRWRSNYDSHFPSSANQSDLGQDWTAILGLWRRPIMGSIPYRSLLPKGLDNILVAGKAYSTDHDALIGGRMQPDMEHLGEVTGVAAAMASRLGVKPREIPVDELQVELVRLGVLRDEDVPGQTIPDGPSLEVLHRQDLWKKERDQSFPPEKSDETYSLDELITQLGTEASLDAMVRLYLAGHRSVSKLRPLLMGSENQRKYEEAATLLGLLGDRSAIPALLDLLRERNTRQFRYTLPNASSRPSVPLYWTSVILLGRLQEKSAVPAMLDLLANAPSPEVLSTQHRSAYGDNMFKDTDICSPPLVSFIVVALGRIGDPSAADAIRPFLKVSNQGGINEENKDFEIAWGIRTNTAWALAQMGDYSGVPVLIELLEADQVQVRDYAHRLLISITGEQFGRDRQLWKEWYTSN